MSSLHVIERVYFHTHWLIFLFIVLVGMDTSEQDMHNIVIFTGTYLRNTYVMDYVV